LVWRGYFTAGSLQDLGQVRMQGCQKCNLEVFSDVSGRLENDAEVGLCFYSSPQKLLGPGW